MSESKFTPGPWHVGEGQLAQIVYDKDGWGIANAVVFHRKHEQGSSLANAKLIAAAPHMLEALEILHASLKRLADGGDAGQMVDEEVEIALAAILKATA